MRTIGLVAFSTGWMVPFTWSVLAIHSFVTNVVWPQVVHLTTNSVVPGIDSFYPVQLAHYAFVFSMAWLFSVIAFWIVRYVRATKPVEKPE